MLFRRKRRFAAGSEDGSRTASISEDEPEPFAEMFSIFRIVAYYELMLHGQWQYVTRFLRKERTELVLGMYIGSAFELIRFICALSLAIIMIMMRLSYILPLHSNSIIGNLKWIASMNTFGYWTALILCALTVTQFIIYQCKHPGAVVISTAFNFVFSILLISAVIHLAIFKANKDAMMKEGFHKAILRDAHMTKLDVHQQKRPEWEKCCGVDGPLDYNNQYILQYVNPLTNVSEGLETERDWSLQPESSFRSMPTSCCRHATPGVPCFERKLTMDDWRRAEEMKNSKDWGSMHQFFLTPEPHTYWPSGCLEKYTDGVDRYVTILITILVIFTIFTALTIGFVIILLLYHEGIGHIVSDTKMFGVERNTGVHFLMSLDMIESDFPDEFSLIEFLRRSDIDKFMAEDRLRDIINGRKDAEQM